MRFLPSCPGVQRIGSLLIRKGQGKSWKPAVAVSDDGLLTGCLQGTPSRTEATMEQRKLYPVEQRKLPPNRDRDLMFFLLGAWVVQILEKLLLLQK